MTATKRRAVRSPDSNYACDWFTTATLKALAIGQFKIRAKNLQCGRRCGKYDSRENGKRRKFQCKASLETCRCCNSTLKYILDSIDLFRKAAKKENLVAKLKDIGKIEVQEENVNIGRMENLESGIRNRKNDSSWEVWLTSILLLPSLHSSPGGWWHTKEMSY